MEANTKLWLGLGVLGVIVLASLDTQVGQEAPALEKDKEKEVPKKVIL
jgi:hypothetical protein